MRCQNQFTVTMGGKLAGIRAEAIETALNVCRVSDDDRLELYDQVATFGNLVSKAHNRNTANA